MVVLEKDLHVCGVLVQEQSEDGAVWVTGEGNTEKVPTGPKESKAYSLIPVGDNQKVSILKHSTFWLFRVRETEESKGKA